MANIALRKKILSKGLKHYEIAKHIGISPGTFSIWMRSELPPEKKKLINQAITEMTEEGVSNG